MRRLQSGSRRVHRIGKRMAVVAFVVAASVSAAAPAAAATELPASIARCAEVSDNLERLTCYDRQNPPRQASVPLAPEASFGENPDLKRKKIAKDPTLPREPDRITTKVVRVIEPRGGEMQFELENGQVWQQTEHRLEVIAEAGDEITITRGALGSFFLVGKSRLSTRVKRMK